MIDLILFILMVIGIFIVYFLLFPFFILIMLVCADKIFNPIWDWYMGKFEKLFAKNGWNWND